MREVAVDPRGPHSEASTLRACIAAILELSLDEIPPPGDDDATGWQMKRWLGGLGLGLVPVEDPPEFDWAGPWIGLARIADGERRAVVMFGVPSGIVWDPSGITEGRDYELDSGLVIASLDVALSRPALLDSPTAVGTVAGIFVAPAAGEPARALDAGRAVAGVGLDGDRHTAGRGTFPSGLPGSAVTLIEAEVCESFDPPLDASEHRRNIVTRGIDLNALVGHEFTVGAVRCRGMRLCEPCTVVERYASRPVLRALVHRGGLRADLLTDGIVRVGDEVRAA